MEQQNDKEYIKGFNEGYLISKNLPDLSNKLSKTDLSDSRGQGMRDGIEQFNLEKSFEKIPDTFRAFNSFEKNIDPTKDIDLEK